MLNGFLALVDDLIPPDQELFNKHGGVYGHPAHRIVEPVHGLVPGADRNAAAAAAGPLSFVHAPENNALFGIDPPLAKTGIMMNRIGKLLTGFALGYRSGRTVFGAAFTGHTKFVGAKGYGFIRKQRQFRCNRLQAHIIAIFR